MVHWHPMPVADQNYLATLISYLWSYVYVTYANDYIVIYIIGYEFDVCVSYIAV